MAATGTILNKNKSILVNAVLNTVRNVLRIVFPLITYPYISRTLGVKGVGTYNYASSIVNYFSLIAAFGISTYAVREGARIRNNKILFKKFANEIFSINIVSTLIAYITLLFCIGLCAGLKNYSVILFLLSIKILFDTLGVEWVFIIYEEYAYITARAILVQIVSLIMMFLFVKTENDVSVYALITVFASTGASIINLISARKFCNFKFTFHLNWNTHKKNILIIFMCGIAGSIYSSMDMTFLGSICGDYYAGLYTPPAKIYDIVKSLLIGIGLVAVPRLSSFIGNGDSEQYTNFAKRIYQYMIVILLPVIVGIMVLSREMIYVIGNKAFDRSVITLQIISIALLFNVSANFWGQCVLLPYKQENKILISVVVATAVNAFLNILFVPKYQHNATAFTTVIAELIAMAIQQHYGRKYLSTGYFKQTMLKTIAGTCIMAWIVLFIKERFQNDIIRLIISTGVGVVAYFAVETLLKNEMCIEMWKLIKKKIRRTDIHE